MWREYRALESQRGLPLRFANSLRSLAQHF
jgi:hypothetical protein